MNSSWKRDYEYNNTKSMEKKTHSAMSYSGKMRRATFFMTFSWRLFALLLRMQTMCHIVYVTLAYLMNKGINRDKKVRVIHCEIAYNIPCSVSTIKLTESFSIRIEHLYFKAFAVFRSFRSRHSILSHRSLSKRQKSFLKQAEKRKEKSTLNWKFR